MSHRRPLFAFWPPAESARDGNRMTRIPRRGTIRQLLLAVLTLVIGTLSASAILAAIQTSWILVIPMAAVIATITVLTLRAWTLGTYVNDRGLAVQRLLSTVTAQWGDVERVLDVDGTVVVHTRAGRVIETTIARRSLDLLGSAEGYDIAKLQLQGWGERH